METSQNCPVDEEKLTFGLWYQMQPHKCLEVVECVEVLPYLFGSERDAVQSLQSPLNTRHVKMLVQSCTCIVIDICEYMHGIRGVNLPTGLWPCIEWKRATSNSALHFTSLIAHCALAARSAKRSCNSNKRAPHLSAPSIFLLGFRHERQSGRAAARVSTRFWDKSFRDAEEAHV